MHVWYFLTEFWVVFETINVIIFQVLFYKYFDLLIVLIKISFYQQHFGQLLRYWNNNFFSPFYYSLMSVESCLKIAIHKYLHSTLKSTWTLDLFICNQTMEKSINIDSHVFWVIIIKSMIIMMIKYSRSVCLTMGEIYTTLYRRVQIKRMELIFT